MKGLILGVSAAAVAGILAMFFLVPLVFPASAVNLQFKQGMSATYADGSCTYSQFSLTKPAILTGTFATNGSAIFQVVDGSQDPMSGGACALPRTYEYSSGSLKQGSINVTLGAGTFTAMFMLGNGTRGQTTLQITHSFVAEYRATLTSPGELCVSLSCRQNNRGPQGPGGTS